jgi:branched-chain amino acid transport system permease protein
MTAFLFQNVIVGLNMAAFYVLMALGLNLMFGISGIINMVHGVVYMLGAYGVFYICQSMGLNFFLAMLVMMASLGLVGMVVEKVFFRMIGGSFAPYVVLTLALMVLVESLAYLGFGVSARGVPAPIGGSSVIFGVSISNYRLAVIPITGVFVLGLYYLIYKTKVGTAIRVIEENKVAGELQGINVDRINALVFFLGFSLAAAAGALISPIYALTPSMGGWPLFKAFLVIIIGGLGSVMGAVLGSLVVGLMDSLIAATLGIELAFIIEQVLVIILLIFRPKGFLGAY